MSLPEPVYQTERVTVYQGDCLEIMPELTPGSMDAVVTDPPYGVKKADWDESFPTEWYPLARELCTGTTFIMPGNSAIPQCLSMIGNDYRDIFVLWLSNGMTLGPCTFGNWIPVVVAQKEKKHLGGQNCLRVVVKPNQKIDHPSPKPLEAMDKLIISHVAEGSMILDPFAGSGTTAVAAIRNKCDCILIEREPKYIEIIKRRLEQEEAQGRLF